MDSNVNGLINTQLPAAASTLANGNRQHLSGQALPVTDKSAIDSAEGKDVESVKVTPTNEDDFISPEDVKLIEGQLDALNQQLQERQRDLSFDIDKSSERPVLRVIHSETGEVIRQIPSELALKIATSLDQGITELVDALA